MLGVIMIVRINVSTNWFLGKMIGKEKPSLFVKVSIPFHDFTIKYVRSE